MDGEATEKMFSQNEFICRHSPLIMTPLDIGQGP